MLALCWNIMLGHYIAGHPALKDFARNRENFKGEGEMFSPHNFTKPL